MTEPIRCPHCQSAEVIRKGVARQKFASGISFRTKINLKQFRCAWFDDQVYYEFVPSEAIVRYGDPVIPKWREP